MLLPSVVRLLRHTDLLDRRGDGLTSSHIDFDTRDKGNGQFFFFPRGMECPPLVLTLTESLSESDAL